MRYDLIVSLGGNCGAASQLKMRGLRHCALPFDWVAMARPETIDYLAEGFADRFRNFCLKEHLRRTELAALQPHCAEFSYLDTYTGFHFIHHFHHAITESGEYEEVRGILERRLCRLLDALGRPGRILFVLATPFAFDSSRAERLLRRLRELFPKAEIEMACLQFSVTFDNPLTLAECWPDGSPFVAGGRYAHPLNEYAFEGTGYEWSFLDEIETVSGRRKPQGWDRLLYKLWKLLSKRLLNRGYACKGVVFPGKHV